MLYIYTFGVTLPYSVHYAVLLLNCTKNRTDFTSSPLNSTNEPITATTSYPNSNARQNRASAISCFTQTSTCAAEG